GMLRAPDWQAAATGPDAPARAGAVISRLAADAACLPLATASVDALLSNFALHWCPDPLQLMRELRRVVRADGLAQLAIPVAGSLD
ncbi:methyltransferase domain-containing protein, partial [Acinetobacter baumannii]